MAASRRWSPASGLVASFVVLGRAAQRPRRYAVATARLASLLGDLARGGVEVEAGGIRTLVQFDGDVLMFLGEEFRSLGPGEKSTALDAHFDRLAECLDPLAQAHELATLLRAAPIALAGLGSGGTEIARVLAEGPWRLAIDAHLPALVLVAVAAVAPRVLWWWLRRRFLSSTRRL